MKKKKRKKKKRKKKKKKKKMTHAVAAHSRIAALPMRCRGCEGKVGNTDGSDALGGEHCKARLCLGPSEPLRMTPALVLDSDGVHRRPVSVPL